MKEESKPRQLQKGESRDPAIQKMLGLFFIGFGLLVLVGLFWEQPIEGRVVTTGAGLLLNAIGVGCILWSKRSGH
jgi:hypothetical protein